MGMVCNNRQAMPIMRSGGLATGNAWNDDPDHRGIGEVVALETMGLFWQNSRPRMRMSGSGRGGKVQTRASHRRDVGVIPEQMGNRCLIFEGVWDDVIRIIAGMPLLPVKLVAMALLPLAVVLGARASGGSVCRGHSKQKLYQSRTAQHHTCALWPLERPAVLRLLGGLKRVGFMLWSKITCAAQRKK